MPGKENHVDATKQGGDGGYVDVTKDVKEMSKEEEARAESRRFGEEESAPPAYTHSGTDAQAMAMAPNEKLPQSLVEDVSAGIRALGAGDPKEIVSVPMIHSVETRNMKKLFSKDRKTVTQTVIVRKMPREHYLKHYAKDAEGNYVGTEKPAVDAGLVFVPSKSSSEDILQQVRKVAFGKMHYNSDFSAGMTMAPFLMYAPGSG